MRRSLPAWAHFKVVLNNSPTRLGTNKYTFSFVRGRGGGGGAVAVKSPAAMTAGRVRRGGGGGGGLWLDRIVVVNKIRLLNWKALCDVP